MTKFILTIDVEEDNQWVFNEHFTLENISKLPKLQMLCNKYEIQPTYLITYTVANNPDSIYLLNEIVKTESCEIGSHLHPWFTPPYEEPFIRAAYPHTFPSECPDVLLQKKLVNLTAKIRSSFGFAPQTYRAGRFGMDSRSLQYLSKLGYTCDTSVTPLWDWSSTEGTLFRGPNYSDVPL